MERSLSPVPPHSLPTHTDLQDTLSSSHAHGQQLQQELHGHLISAHQACACLANWEVLLSASAPVGATATGGDESGSLARCADPQLLLSYQGCLHALLALSTRLGSRSAALSQSCTSWFSLVESLDAELQAEWRAVQEIRKGRVLVEGEVVGGGVVWGVYPIQPTPHALSTQALGQQGSTSQGQRAVTPNVLIAMPSPGPVPQLLPGQGAPLITLTSPVTPLPREHARAAVAVTQPSAGGTGLNGCADRPGPLLQPTPPRAVAVDEEEGLSLPLPLLQPQPRPAVASAEEGHIPPLPLLQAQVQAAPAVASSEEDVALIDSWMTIAHEMGREEEELLLLPRLEGGATDMLGEGAGAAGLMDEAGGADELMGLVAGAGAAEPLGQGGSAADTLGLVASVAEPLGQVGSAAEPLGQGDGVAELFLADLPPLYFGPPPGGPWWDAGAGQSCDHPANSGGGGGGSFPTR